MFLARQVLDLGLVDRSGRKIGKVDDIVLQLRDGRPPVVHAIRGGRGALAQYLPVSVQRIAAWLRAGILGEEGMQPPGEIGWEHVNQIDVVVHLDLDRANVGLLRTETAIWDRWIRRIPWAER